MRKFGVLCASLALAIAATAEAQEPFPDPPIMVNTPSGTTVPVNLPSPTVSAQPYAPTTQPLVVPVPINLYVTPNIVQRQVPVTIPVPTPVVQQPPAPVFPPQPPQPRGNQACIPIDGRTPLPFDIPMDTPNNGPLTSTVLPPPAYAVMQRQPLEMAQVNALEPYPTNPLLQQAVAQTVPQRPIPPYGLSYPAPSPYPPQPIQTLEPATVPPPGAPYVLDAQGRPHYVQPPTSPLPGPQQWPGYTPVNYGQMQPVPAPQPLQQQYAAQAGQFYTPDLGLAPVPVPPELNPTLNPNLTNPNTPVQLISAEQVRQAVWSNAPITIMDVRGDLVRDVLGHIPNDISVPLQPSQTFPARARNAIANPNNPVVVYCNDGINSSQAANMLANMGYKVYLMGVYTGWGNHLPTAGCTACPQ